jgi:hypothetical protein
VSQRGGAVAARGRDHSKLERIGELALPSASIDAGVGKIAAEKTMSATLSTARRSEFTPLPVGG